MSAFNTQLWGGGTVAGTLPVSARALIYRALRDLGVLRPGQQASEDSMADGLASLNEMLDSWNTERLTVRSIARDVYETAAGTVSVAAGVSRIEQAGWISGSRESELDLPTHHEWAAVSDKSATGEPGSAYIDYTYPEANVYLHPVPSSAGQLALYRWSTLELFADLDAEYALPPGYALALRACLAEQLAPSFTVLMKIPNTLLAHIAEQARKSKARIKRLNLPRLELKCDDALLIRRRS